MLQSITFGTFYFFLAFCVILFVWVMFFVPETKGVPIEEMDKIFGGNQGQADMHRITEIRNRLGILSAEEMDLDKTKEADVDYATVEEQE
jgi:hypothetical protein